MISDSPPDRDLEWTDAGIQSSKNLTNRIERFFQAIPIQKTQQKMIKNLFINAYTIWITIFQIYH